MQDQPLELTSQEQATLDKAQTKHYVIIEMEQRNLETKYWEYCKLNFMPYVGIVYHGKGKHLHWLVNDEDTDISEEEHAEVHYDLFLIQRKLTPNAMNQVRKEINRFQPVPYQNLHMHLDEVAGRITLPHYVTEKLAAILFEIISQPEATLPDPHKR